MSSDASACSHSLSAGAQSCLTTKGNDKKTAFELARAKGHGADFMGFLTELHAAAGVPVPEPPTRRRSSIWGGGKARGRASIDENMGANGGPRRGSMRRQSTVGALLGKIRRASAMGSPEKGSPGGSPPGLPLPPEDLSPTQTV